MIINKVSIITPLFNRLDLVAETWQSIQQQTFQSWEWIVVDDGSTDGGDEFIKQISLSDDRVTFLYRQGLPKGPSRCRNLGVENATGQYVLFLDSDDLITATCLEKRVAFLEGHQDLDFAVFTQATFEEKISKEPPIFTKYFLKNKDYLNSFIADQPPWQTSGPLWKIQSFKKTNGFREDYTIMEDPEFHIRAIMQGLQFKVIKDLPDFFYRLSPKTPEQKAQFWKNSTLGRIIFYQNLYPELKTIEQQKALQQGIINLYKIFLLSRINDFKDENKLFMDWLQTHQLISGKKIKAIHAFANIAGHPLFNKLPIVKGLLYKYITN